MLTNSEKMRRARANDGAVALSSPARKWAGITRREHRLSALTFCTVGGGIATEYAQKPEGGQPSDRRQLNI